MSGEFRISKSDSAWREQLTDEQYRIAREGGTEPAFCGLHLDNKVVGRYDCVCCDVPLFSSRSKYDSGTGWPSFFAPIDLDAVVERPDNTHGMRRIEVLCSTCGAHLGHVFPDGPEPSRLRYCMNGHALRFVATT